MPNKAVTRLGLRAFFAVMLPAVLSGTPEPVYAAGPGPNMQPISGVAVSSTWRGPMLSYRSRIQFALDGLSSTSMPPDWLPRNQAIPKNNLAFVDNCAPSMLSTTGPGPTLLADLY